MKKIAGLFAMVAFSAFSYADVIEDAIHCDYGYSCLDKYGSVLTRLCDRGNTRACNTLAKNYYEKQDSESGDYYACKAGVTEMCHKDSESPAYTETDSYDRDDSTTTAQEESQTCITEEERMVGCVHRKYHDDGSVEFTPYKNDNIHGIAKIYYPTGQLGGEASYKNGALHGIAKMYYENGQLGFEEPYKNGKKEGMGKYYYENGMLNYEVPYKNDVVHGMTRRYYENGNKHITLSFQNGRKHGVEKYYYQNGNLLAEIPYLEDKPNGIIKYYLTGNKLVWQITAQKGKLINGKCVSGKTLTNSHLTKILNDINRSRVDNWHVICQ